MDEATNINTGTEADKPKIKKWQYYADIAKWVISFVGVIIDAIKTNPFPKKDDYTAV